MSGREPPPIMDDNPPSPPRRPTPEPPPPSTVEPVKRRLSSSILDAVAGDWDGTAGGDESARVMAGLVHLRRRPVDPMTDYVADGTRIPRFIKDAMAHEAALTGRSAQEILRDALLGVRPLSAELLDAHYLDLYGAPRGEG
jgi:hypothetical protein